MLASQFGRVALNFAKSRSSNVAFNATKTSVEPQRNLFYCQKRYYPRMSRLMKKQTQEQKEKILNTIKEKIEDAKARKTMIPNKPATLGMVADPWIWPGPMSPLTTKFWKNFARFLFVFGKTQILGSFLIPYATSQGGFQRITKNEILDNAKEIYTKYYRHAYDLDFKSIYEYTSPSVAEYTQGRYSQARLPPGLSSEWKLGDIRALLLNYTVIRTPELKDVSILQASVKIISEQTLVVKNLQGDIVGGSNEMSTIRDYWVIEKMLDRPNSPWTIASTDLALLTQVGPEQAAEIRKSDLERINSPATEQEQQTVNEIKRKVAEAERQEKEIQQQQRAAEGQGKHKRR